MDMTTKLEQWRLAQPEKPTRQELEQATNSAKGYFTLLAQGARRPTWQTKLRIARALGASISDLFEPETALPLGTESEE